MADDPQADPAAGDPERGEGIDPTAFVHPTAKIGRGVYVGVRAYVGPHVTIGDGCTLRSNSMVLSDTTLGVDNDVHPYAVLGGEPQDRAYRPGMPSSLVIGDGNIFREHVTISRSTGDPPTRIGSHGFYMAYVHVGHNACIGDRGTFANSAAIAGHARVGDHVTLSSHTGIHQFCEVGDGVMYQAASNTSMHVPPYVVCAANNAMHGLNTIGLRRAGFDARARAEVNLLYRALCRERGPEPIAAVLDRLEPERPWSEPAKNFMAFFRRVLSYEPPWSRGIIMAQRGTRKLAATGERSGPAR